MRQLLESLPTDERRGRLYSLAMLHIEEFNRENNLVRNAALLDTLKLRQAMAQVLGPPKPTPRPRVLRDRAPQGPLRKSSRLVQGQQEGSGPAAAEMDGEPEGDEGREDEGEGWAGNEAGIEDRQEGELGEKDSVEDGEEGGGNGAEREKESGHGEGKGEGATEARAQPNKEKWPKWMGDGGALLVLEACPAGGAEDWATAVTTWALLEEAYGFQTSVSL
jgi:hypothetical protein